MIFGYIRVSTQEQNTDRQEEALKSYVEPQNTYIDKATGKNFNRPQYKELKKVLRSGDVLYIKSLDRLGRNKADTLKEIRDIQNKGIILRVLELPTTMVDYGSNALMMETINNIIIELYTMMAEQELNNIKSRQREGISAMPVNKEGKKVSKKTGRATGRPERELNKDFIIVYDGVIKGLITNKEAMSRLNMSKATYYRYVKQYKESHKEEEQI